MKCEYCDNPVPNGVTRCPSCGAAVNFQAYGEAPTSPVSPVSSQASGMAFAQPRSENQSRSRIVYILLGVFFGILGIHNFYAGRTYRGLWQLLITLFTGWFLLPLLAVWVWSIVDICVISTDGDGTKFK